MGRKGVSKRKPKQTKQSSTPVSGENSGRSSAQDARRAESQPLLVTDKSRASSTPGGETKPSASANKKNKKR